MSRETPYPWLPVSHPRTLAGVMFRYRDRYTWSTWSYSRHLNTARLLLLPFFTHARRFLLVGYFWSFLVHNRS